MKIKIVFELTSRDEDWVLLPIPSISLSKTDKTLSWTPELESESSLLVTIPSISSINSTEGAPNHKEKKYYQSKKYDKLKTLLTPFFFIWSQIVKKIDTLSANKEFWFLRTRVNWKYKFSQKWVLDKQFFDLTFTDFQTGCQKLGIILEFKVFQKVKFN